MTSTYAPAAVADAMAGMPRAYAYARVGGLRPCVPASWSPTSFVVTTADRKHGRPRRTQESP